MNNRRYTITYHPECLTKQPSYFCLHDLITDTYQDYVEEKTLGEGNHGYVRLFVHGNEKIAVKGFVHEGKRNIAVTDPQFHELKKDAINELKFLRKANGNSQLCTLKHIIEPGKRNQADHYSFRLTVPYVEGDNLDDFASKFIHRVDDLALLCLRVAQAIQQLHDDGVIHGDIGSRNLLVKANRDDFIVQPIDFGLSYPLNGLATSGFLRLPSQSNYTLDVAEERYKQGKVIAHPSQDVYTLGRVYETMLVKMGTAYIESIRKEYPCIIDFIKQADTDEISDRPDLPTFIAQLSQMADWINTQSKTTQQLLQALAEPSLSPAIKILESKAGAFTHQAILSLLYELIRHRKFEETTRLLCIKKRLAIDSLNEVIISTQHEQNYQGDTFAHVVAREGTADIALNILKLKIALDIKNNQGKTALECASDTVKPIFELFAMIQRLASQPRDTSTHRFFSSIFRKPPTDVLMIAQAISEALICRYSTSEMNDLFIRHQQGMMENNDMMRILQDMVTQQLLPAQALQNICLSNTNLARPERSI